VVVFTIFGRRKLTCMRKTERRLV